MVERYSVEIPSRLASQRNPKQQKRQRKRESCLIRQGRYWYYRILRLQGHPSAIARGIATGMFAGFFPLFGLQTVFGVVLATIAQGNKFAAAIATWVSNPFTYVPIYTFNYAIGSFVLGGERITPEHIDWTSAGILELGVDFLSRLFIGCAIVGSIAAVIGYFLSFPLIKRLRQFRHQSRRR